MGAHEHHLLVTIHHIIADEWSLDLLCHELGILYTAYVSGGTPALSELPIQYADYAQEQEAWLQSERSQQGFSYWVEQLTNAPITTTIPADRPRPPVQTSRGATQSVVIPRSLADGLIRLSQQAGATLFMTALAAFFALLHRYTSQEDLVVGCPIAGRTRTEYEGLIGVFINTLILRADLSKNPTFWELIDRVRTVALDAYAHQDVPFERLVEVLQPHRDLSFNPMFQLMFVFLEYARRWSLEFAGLTVERCNEETATAKFDLTLYLEENADGLAVKAELTPTCSTPAPSAACSVTS